MIKVVDETWRRKDLHDFKLFSPRNLSTAKEKSSNITSGLSNQLNPEMKVYYQQ